MKRLLILLAALTGVTAWKLRKRKDRGDEEPRG